MESNIRTILAAALLVSASGLAGAATEEPIADVSLRFNPATVSLPDVAGESAIHAVLEVTNRVELAVVLISVRAAEGSSFALIQEPAPGWATKATRTTVEFTGVLASEQTVELPVRIVDSAAARSGQFEIFVHTIEADLSFSLFTPLTPLEADAGNYACQLVFMGYVDDAMSFVPISTVGSVASSGYLLAAVYDPAYRTYIDPARVTGSVKVTALGFERGELPLALDILVNAPFVNTAIGPTLTLPGTAAQVRAVELWGATGANRAWFGQHPGAFAIEATVAMDGENVCEARAYDFAASTSPDVAAAAPDLGALSVGTPLALVPPELDSDLDGYANVAELRANSNPLWHGSTPYTDDDDDGVENGRDLLTVPVPLEIGA